MEAIAPPYLVDMFSKMTQYAIVGEELLMQRIAPPNPAKPPTPCPFPPLIVKPLKTAPVVPIPIKVKALLLPPQSIMQCSAPFTDSMVMAF